MLRMKSRKRTRKMRGGGIFGPEFGGHVNKANEQAAYGWGKFLSGVEVGRRESKIARDNASRGYNENIKRTDSLGGNPPLSTPPLSTPPLPTIPPPSVTTSYKPHRPVLYSPTQDPLTLVKKYNKPTGTIIDKYKGGRKTKKRRRKRKKKKTKRKKRRRKRKTKKRRRKKYN